LTKESRGTPRRSSKSGIGSFLVPLNVEQKKQTFESRSLSNAKKIADRSASPKLKPRRKNAKKAIKLKMDQLKLAKMTKKEGPITTKNFGKTESAPAEAILGDPKIRMKLRIVMGASLTFCK
jgi:hypothetical protein